MGVLDNFTQDVDAGKAVDTYGAIGWLGGLSLMRALRNKLFSSLRNRVI